MRGRPGARPYVAAGRLLILVAVTISTAFTGAIASSSDVSTASSRLIGHPRARFPLTIYLSPGVSHRYKETLEDAAAQWNAVFERLFNLRAFTWNATQNGADVVIRFKPFPGRGRGHPIGETELDADRRGVIKLPVIVTLSSPGARGGTNARQMLFDVAAHELGHALGLPHINDPKSIMCCEPGGIDFKNPTIRTEYIEAREHPDLSEDSPNLKKRYTEFWNQQAK